MDSKKSKPKSETENDVKCPNCNFKFNLKENYTDRLVCPDCGYRSAVLPIEKIKELYK